MSVQRREKSLGCGPDKPGTNPMVCGSVITLLILGIRIANLRDLVIRGREGPRFFRITNAAALQTPVQPHHQDLCNEWSQ